MPTTGKIARCASVVRLRFCSPNFLRSCGCGSTIICIMLADFEDTGDGFGALFDNLRDARLFQRRFTSRSMSNAPARTSPRQLPTVAAHSKEMPGLGDLIPVANAA